MTCRLFSQQNEKKAKLLTCSETIYNNISTFSLLERFDFTAIHKTPREKTNETRNIKWLKYCALHKNELRFLLGSINHHIWPLGNNDCYIQLSWYQTRLLKPLNNIGTINCYTIEGTGLTSLRKRACFENEQVVKIVCFLKAVDTSSNYSK